MMAAVSFGLCVDPVCACVYLCMYVCAYICMHVCIHATFHVYNVCLRVLNRYTECTYLC